MSEGRVTDPSEIGNTFQIRRVVEYAFGLAMRNWGTWLPLSVALVGLPQFLLSLLLQALGVKSNFGLPPVSAFFVGAAVAAAVTAIPGCLFVTSVISGALADLDGGSPSWKDVCADLQRSSARVLVISLLKWVATLAGLVLLVVPGVVMWLAWAVAVPVAIREQSGVIGSLVRSANLTRAHRFRVLGLLVIFLLLSLLAGFVAGVLLGFPIGLIGAFLPSATRASLMHYTPQIGAAVGEVAASLITVPGTAAMYFELRRLGEGLGSSRTADVFN